MPIYEYLFGVMYDDGSVDSPRVPREGAAIAAKAQSVIPPPGRSMLPLSNAFQRISSLEKNPEKNGKPAMAQADRK